MDQKPSIYIVTTSEKDQENIYKVGLHTGPQSRLIQRYRTPLINPIITYFVYNPWASEIEAEVLKELDGRRITNELGHKTEWIHYERTNIILCIERIIKKIGDTRKDFDKNAINVLTKVVEDLEIDDVHAQSGDVDMSPPKGKKTCHHCGEEKVLDDFPRHKKMKDGYGNTCKSCDRERSKSYRLKVRTLKEENTMEVTLDINPDQE
jgi:hypothetical protein